MKRTQLYLDDDLWNVLHARARSQGTTVSDLVRRATREHYLGTPQDRADAMNAVIGLWRGRAEFSDSTKYVRSLRRGRRLERLEKQ